MKPGCLITTPQRRTLARICIATVLLVVTIISSSVILTQHLSHDEHMYLSAAKMLSHGKPYVDFSYLQTPYMPFVYYLVMKATQSESILLVGRVTQVSIIIALILVIFRLASLLSSDMWFALACVLLLLQSDIFLDSIGYARNYDLPMLVVLVAGWLTFSMRSHPATSLIHAGSGFLVGLAIGTKLTYLLIPFAFGMLVLINFGISKRSLTHLASFSLGLGIALLPAILLALNAGIDRVWFNNLGYHSLNTTWRAQMGYTRTMSFFGKLSHAEQTLWTVPSQFLFALELFLLAVIVKEKRPIASILRAGSVLWCTALVTLSIPMLFIPTPIWKSYYLPLIIFSVLLIASLYSQISLQIQTVARLLAFVCVFLLIVPDLSGHARLAWSAIHPANWTSTRISKEGSAMRQAIPVEYHTRPVATLSPVYALEAGLNIYPELATGPFAYRIGDLLSSEDIQRFHTISPQYIGELLNQRPPSAILVGFEGELDKKLEDFAVQNSYGKREDVILGATLYIRQHNHVDSNEE